MLFTPATPHAVIFTILLVGGFFRSLQFTAINGLGYADLDAPRMSQATSLSSVMQQISVSMGVAVSATALEWTRGERADMTLVPADFLPAFLVVGAISLASMLVFARLAPDAGSEVSGHLPDQPSSRVAGSM